MVTKAESFMQVLQGDRVETVDSVLRRQRIEWLEDLETLRKSVRGWLAPVVKQHVSTVKDIEFDLDEPDLGFYEVGGLEIRLVVGSQTEIVRVRPRGMRIVGVIQTNGKRVVGAQGRVDIECGAAREILLRFRDKRQTKWASYATGKKVTLDEGVFFDLLARVTKVHRR